MCQLGLHRAATAVDCCGVKLSDNNTTAATAVVSPNFVQQVSDHTCKLLCRHVLKMQTLLACAATW
jgi:hypothetical protein